MKIQTQQNTNASIPSSPAPRKAGAPRLNPVWVAWLIAGWTGLAFGQNGIPSAINYQGRLTDNLGKDVSSGYYQVQFRIWDHPTQNGAGNYVWGRAFALHVSTNGMFNVLLDDSGSVVSSPGTPRTTSLLSAFEGPDRYLGLSIAANPSGPLSQTNEISPRQRLVSSPFAMHAQNASNAGLATNATTAAYSVNAGNASYATNAGKFGSFNTNDFLMVNKSAQTLNGSLTISNGSLTLKNTLSVNSNVTVNGQVAIGTSSAARALQIGDANTAGSEGVIRLGSRAASGNYSRNWDIGVLQTGSDVSGLGYGFMINDVGAGTNAQFSIKYGSGDVNMPNNVNVGKRLTVANNTPIMFKRYSLGSQSGDVKRAYYNTSQSTNIWSAAIVGIHSYGDIQEDGNGPLVEYVINPDGANGTWRIEVGVHHHSGDLSEIWVDVMFIRRELTTDDRPTTTALSIESSEGY